ncbi:hypothetical protein JZ751_019668 [Albula glossodonta]|uniref:Uncharacterized protein n=1 Tax=Albula glossodonta TaxID=121402 RepID=A0A8T2NXV7_9TELE|nr:hypothetical protein JZ751_019668 [Albula glossodonta]
MMYVMEESRQYDLEFVIKKTMMSSKPTPHFMDQVAQGTLPRVERTVGTTLSSELPKSGYPPEDPVNYSGTYFYCLSGAAGTDLSPHWSPPVYHGLHPPSTCTYEEMQQMALTYPGIQPKIYPDHPPPVPSVSMGPGQGLGPGLLCMPRLLVQKWPLGVKLSAFKIIVPDVLRPPPQTHQTQALEVPQPTPEPKPAIDSSRQARHRFMEMQQSLFRLISASVAQAPEPELRAWLAKTEPLEPTSPQSKALCVSGLLGTATREAWLRCKDTAAALARVAGQLEDYAVTRQCPFPHVIRAGTLFIPMLVVKECLFPQVSGALIDKVLQEHHVELRPTTLSEERHLMQLQRRACSSKLRRLLSLKHLPEIYPDMLNLFYHACVSKRLGSVLSTPVKTEKPEYSEEAEGSRSGMSTESTPGPLGPCEHLKDVSMGSRLKKQKRKGRRRGASKRKLLEKDKLIEGDTFGYSAQSESWSIVNSFSLDGDGQGSQSPHSENLETMNIKLEENSSSEEVSQGCKEEPESTWGPLTSDELSSGNSDTEIEKASLPQYRNQPSNTTKSQAIPKSHSGMILKLRKVLFKYPYGRDLGYQPARDNTQPDHMGDQGGRGGIEERQKEQSVARRMRPRVARRRQRAGSFPEVLRPTRSSSKVPRLHGSLQLKYCPHLSACYCSQHRRRWVLRSAVQTARRAMKNRYPDLVGKRIRHLYEENDKSEVWYRGVVVRVHEPHLNPLKTVFEVKYDSEPEWQYYLELLMDYKKGWLKVED